MSTFRRAAAPEAAPRSAPRSAPEGGNSRSQASRNPQQGERLSKRVMQLKNCSRSQAEQYIEGGWVMVNGVVVEDPPFRVQQQVVTVAADASLLDAGAVTLILNKPADWLDGLDGLQADAPVDSRPRQKAAGRGQPPAQTPVQPPAQTPVQPPAQARAPANARRLLTPAAQFAGDSSGIRLLKRHLLHLQADVPLETGASGLLVFTQDWRTTRKLREDMVAMEHEFMVDIAGQVPPEALQAIARALNDGRNALPATKVSISSSTPDWSKLRFAIKGAHPGLVAYLCDRAALPIQAMRRIRLGRVGLGELPPGQWRYLAAHERF